MLIDADVARIAYADGMPYPLHTKADFVRAMTRFHTVEFQGHRYDSVRGAELLPAFLFPVSDAADLLAKVGEVLAARGLATWSPSARHAVNGPPSGPLLPRVPSRPPRSHLARVLSRLELALASAEKDGRLPAERVDALDIIAHGLEFTAHPEGLRLWRDALWHGRLHPEARAAVIVMGQHVQEAAERGEWAAITAICDCLDELLEPSARRSTGGSRGSLRTHRPSPEEG